MVLLVVVTGAIWAFDALVLAKRRREIDLSGTEASAHASQPSQIVEYARSFFPVFLIVLVLRSFLFEPFRIPSGSMMPTLLVGDFILVNKFRYGIRLPVTDTKVIPIGEPQRGDVIVFRYPKDPSTPYIKRVVAVPGDIVSYKDKTLLVNGETAAQELIGPYTGFGSGAAMTGADLRLEDLTGVEHQILVSRTNPNHDRSVPEIEIKEGEYFVLGDNRDNSKDSRWWGTVPEELLIGKAFWIWLNVDWGHGIGWGRIGTSIE